MIYDYLKEQLGTITEGTIRECYDKLNEAERDIKKLRQEIQSEWRYCVGCKDYVKRTEAYEGVVYIPVENLDDPNNTRHALKCCRCNTIIDFLD